MATRLYPTFTVPNVRIEGPVAGTWGPEGAYGSTWNPAQWTWRLATTKVPTFTPHELELHTNQQGDYDLQVARWMTKPLAAQAIGGTFDLCFWVNAQWVTAGDVTEESIVRYRVHVYLAVGQSAQKRVTLLDYVDTVNVPGNSGLEWRSLAAAQPLAAATVEAGDVLVVELGFRIVSSPTPVPTYVPTATTQIHLRALCARDSLTDAVAGDTDTSRAPWFDFSDTLTELAAPPAPAQGTTCATAIPIPTALPYESAWIDTTSAPGTERELFFTWTAPTSGKVFFHTFGSNYGTVIDVLTGSCAALTAMVDTHGGKRTATELAAHRSHTLTVFDAVAGTTYWLRVRNLLMTYNSPGGGGLLRLSGCYRDTTPAVNDLYLPGQLLVALRDGQLVNFSADWYGVAPTGVAIDYTKRPMVDFDNATHAKERLVMGLHNVPGGNLIEILDLASLHWADWTSEVDYIAEPFDVIAPSLKIHPAQLQIDTRGTLYSGWFGNGYLYVAGTGILPAQLNTVSNNALYSALKVIDATAGDNQAGAPFAAVPHVLPPEVTAAWAIAYDEPNGIVYYTSGGFYTPVGGQRIKRWNITAASAMPDFAVLPLQGGNNPGLKGLCVLPGGGLLVCNGTVVQRLNAQGALIATFTPSIPADSQTLVSVDVTADGRRFWVLDLETTRLFKFNLETGSEEATHQPYLEPGTVVQFTLYKHVCECCMSTKLSIINEALLKIGVSKTLDSVNEQSREALTANLLYDKTLRETLRQHPWSFATKYAKATDAVVSDDPMWLVAGTPTVPVNGDWLYAYRYPDDCLLARRIVSASGVGRRFDPNPIAFRVGRTWELGEDADTLLVYTNEADAVLEYTAVVECAENFADDLFEDAVTWRLASKLAPSLSRMPKMTEQCWAMYLHTLDTAAAVSSRESQQERHGEPDWISGRD